MIIFHLLFWFLFWWILEYECYLLWFMIVCWHFYDPKLSLLFVVLIVLGPLSKLVLFEWIFESYLLILITHDHMASPHQPHHIMHVHCELVLDLGLSFFDWSLLLKMHRASYCHIAWRHHSYDIIHHKIENIRHHTMVVMCLFDWSGEKANSGAVEKKKKKPSKRRQSLGVNVCIDNRDVRIVITMLMLIKMIFEFVMLPTFSANRDYYYEYWILILILIPVSMIISVDILDYALSLWSRTSLLDLTFLTSLSWPHFLDLTSHSLWK